MFDKICLINQPSGLGDIFFSQKIAQVWMDGGYRVVWPVEDHYFNQYDNMKYIDSDVDFCSVSDDFIRKDLFITDPKQIVNESNFIYIPLKYSFDLLNGLNPYNGSSLSFLSKHLNPIMEAKYYLTQIDYYDWYEYFNFRRNVERENYMFYDILNLKDDTPFVLSNRYFSNSANRLKTEEPYSIVSDFPIVEMGDTLFDIFGAGENLFDWCKVFEDAFEIHTVDTSIPYIIEKLDVTENLFLYERFGYQSYEDMVGTSNQYSKLWSCPQ